MVIILSPISAVIVCIAFNLDLLRPRHCDVWVLRWCRAHLVVLFDPIPDIVEVGACLVGTRSGIEGILILPALLTLNEATRMLQPCLDGLQTLRHPFFAVDVGETEDLHIQEPQPVVVQRVAYSFYRLATGVSSVIATLAPEAAESSARLVRDVSRNILDELRKA